MENQTITAAKENLLLIQERASGASLPLDDALAIVQLQATIAIAEELNRLTNLLANETKIGGSLNNQRHFS